VFDAAGEKVVSVAVFSSDITKRKQAEEALRQSHDLLEHILSSVPDAILSIKMPERTINWANDSFNVLGYEPEEYVGQSAKKYYANPEDYYAVGDLQQNAIRKGDDVISTEVMGLRKDGRVIPVELTATFYKEEGKLSLVTACIRDISVRKQAEEASRQSHDFLQHLTTSMPGAVFSTKMPERTIEWANDSFHVLGYEPEECVGKTTEFLYPSQKDFLAFGDMIEHAISEGEEVLHVEQILRKKSGEIFPAGISLSFFKKEAELVSITAIVQDISERKQKEQQLQIYQQRLKALAYQLTITEERERHAIATDLHDHVGQSLALARIQLTSARQFASESKLVDKLDDISGTLLKILEDTQLLMLELSSPAMHETGLSSAISEWLESQIENRHSLKTEVIDNISHNRRKTLDANVRTILFRNVRELIINVVKHARTNKVSVRLEDRDTSIRVIVEDDGIGFDPLAVTQADSKAGGFGLFSIQELMADLGGDLKIVSEPGKGCTAILSAPFSDEEIT
jgi:PAS domain S-box-containing protein